MGRSGKDPIRYSEYFESRPFVPRAVVDGRWTDYLPERRVVPTNGRSRSGADDEIGSGLEFTYIFDFDLE
jgi:hypothetical protein